MRCLDPQRIRRLGPSDHDMGEPETASPTTAAPADATTAPTNATMAPTDMPTNSTDSPVTGAYEHVGCYNDNKDDRVLGHKMKSPTMTPDVSGPVLSFSASQPNHNGSMV